jgi:hypothetical protein
LKAAEVSSSIPFRQSESAPGGSQRSTRIAERTESSSKPERESGFNSPILSAHLWTDISLFLGLNAAFWILRTDHCCEDSGFISDWAPAKLPSIIQVPISSISRCAAASAKAELLM